MKNSKYKVENAKDKVIGKAKETVGSASGDQEMELEGKLQYQKGNLKEKVDKTKDKISEKFNDTLNKK